MDYQRALFIGDELIGKAYKSWRIYRRFVHKANVLGDVEVVGINSPDFVFGGLLKLEYS